MPTAVAVASLVITAGSSYEQYRQAKKTEKAQDEQAEIQQSIQLSENRRELVRQTARARILRARAQAEAEARGAGSGDSGTAGATSGLSATLAGQRGLSGTRREQGNRLTELSGDIASARTAGSIAAGVQNVAGSVFSVTGGSLFD